ncbi:methylaspartate ammonia-lyase [Mesorhizobium sp. M0601]|uniref:methylaspartate ammonia-lyase n=1 Tax=Mesorhizobium sp. M0601 TaxID=2956969 RepID=UPI003337129C
MQNKVVIENVIFAAGDGASFYDDQEAIRRGVKKDGYLYTGTPITKGFSKIRQPAAALGIGLALSDKQIVWGDMMSVQYAGAAGRDPLFDVAQIEGLVRQYVVPHLIGINPSNFKAACDEALGVNGGGGLPVSVEYGVSQALLEAAAYVQRVTMAEVIASELHLPTPMKRVPIYCQTGDEREINVDKMILKSVDILPHGLTNSAERFGRRGEVFREYVRWVVDRIRKVGEPTYHPGLHFDVYGWVGLEFGLEPKKIAEFIAQAADDADGFDINIECPADFGSTEAQIDGYRDIVREMTRIGTRARIVADEYCNTLEDIRRFAEAGSAHLIQIKMPDVGPLLDTAKAVVVCKDNGVGAYVGGSASETDVSARISVHIAMATQADMMLAKPGMGVDEAVTIVRNEQHRLLATLASRNVSPKTARPA